MTSPKKALLALAILALGACTNPDRFGDGANDVNLNSTFDPTLNGLGDPSNPNSPAYFNQTVGDRVLFAVDTSTLTSQGETVLSQQAAWLMANGEYNATIEGHADEQGTREYNLNLGERRANAVREFLISQGVAANRISTISYGKERPIEICSEEACYAQNRRAVTVLGAIPTS
ncbi:MAG: peptidoglycan-associated lipoprotein Pal [Pseudomonadota bacterium]